MHSKADWTLINEQADEALTQSLRAQGVSLSVRAFRARLGEYYRQRDKDMRETTYHFVLRELLKELGYPDAAEATIREALDALYAVTQSNWELESDARATLEILKSQNYKMGIFSNAGDDKDVRQLLEKFNIRDYFDFALTSAASFYRKPHPRAFEISLAHWSATPAESAMIGDSLEADIFGAKQIGMTAIWLTRRAQFNAETIRRVQPPYSIRKLSELPPLLDSLSFTRREML